MAHNTHVKMLLVFQDTQENSQVIEDKKSTKNDGTDNLEVEVGWTFGNTF